MANYALGLYEKAMPGTMTLLSEAGLREGVRLRLYGAEC